MCSTPTHFWGCAGCPLGLVLYTCTALTAMLVLLVFGLLTHHTTLITGINDYNNGITLFQNCYTDSVQTCAASSVASNSEVEVNYSHSGSTETTMYIKYVTQNSTIYFNVKFNDIKGGRVTCTAQQLTYMIIHIKSDIEFLNKVHSRGNLSRLFHSWHIE